MQLMDVKKQLETQTTQYHRTREQLTAAQLELNNLKLQMSSRESRLVSPTALTGEKFLSYLFKFGSSTSLTAKTRALLIEKTLWSCCCCFSSSGLQGSEGDTEALRAQLKQAESKVEDLAERLKNTIASMEQYKAMSLSLEESLDKEKQVGVIIKNHYTSLYSNNLYLPLKKRHEQ